MQRVLFELLESVELKILSLQTVLSDSRNPETLARICAQSSLHSLSVQGGELVRAASEGPCPCVYVDCTQTFRSSEQIFVCFGGQEKGKTVFKLKLAH